MSKVASGNHTQLSRTMMRRKLGGSFGFALRENEDFAPCEALKDNNIDTNIW